MRDDIRQTVFIPLAAGLVSGLFVLVFAAALCAWRGWPGIWAAIAGAGAALASWFAWSGRMAAILEHRAGLAKVPIQTAKTQTVDLHIHETDAGGYASGAFLDGLRANEQTLGALAGMVLSGGSLTTSQVCASGLLTRASWEALRDRFIAAGLLSWRGGNRAHGCELTPRGWRVFARLAPPPPTGASASNFGTVGAVELHTHTTHTERS